jgi:hypothetical protein
MDKSDAEKYTTVFGLLADLLERERPIEEERGMSFALGDLARRMFVGTKFDPPDELLEEVAHAIRSGEEAERERVAARLRDHAEHLTDWEE